MRPEEELSPVLQALVDSGYDPRFNTRDATEEDKAIMDLIPFRTFAWNERHRDLYQCLNYDGTEDTPILVWFDWDKQEIFASLADLITKMSERYRRYFPESIPFPMKLHVATIIKAQEIDLPIDTASLHDEFCGFVDTGVCYMLSVGWFQCHWDGELSSGVVTGDSVSLGSGTEIIDKLVWLRDHASPRDKHSVDEYVVGYSPSAFEVQLR